MAAGAAPSPLPGSCSGCVLCSTAIRSFVTGAVVPLMSYQARLARKCQVWGKVLLGVVSVVVLGLVALPLLAQVLAPRLERVQEIARETGVITAIKTIQTEQLQYLSTFSRFATTLTQLGPPATGGSVSPEALIPTSLASGQARGYLITITPTPTGYSMLALPQNGAGRRTFYSDESGIIRENWGAEPATATSPEVGSSTAK